MIDLLKTAFDYKAAGLSILPVLENAKRPKLGTWEEFQCKPMSDDDLLENFKNVDRIGVVCGVVSGGLIMLDFDNHTNESQEIFDAFFLIEDVKPIFEKYNFPIESTPSGGFHIYFRVKDCADGNKKLASKLDAQGKRVTLIETRGDGGFSVMAPTEGYKLMYHDFSNIPLITENEKEVIYCAAMSFNQCLETVKKIAEPFKGGTNRPGDDYNRSSKSVTECFDLLRRTGWKSTNDVHWKRPGKTDSGISATFGKVAPGWFYVFSTNAPPFDGGHAYTCFQIKTLLEFNADFKACAGELAKQGFGEQRPGNYKQAAKLLHQHNQQGVKLCPADILSISEMTFIPLAEVQTLSEKIYTENKDEHDIDSKPNIYKVEVYLNKHYVFARNEVIDTIEMKIKKTGLYQEVNVDSIYCDLLRLNMKFKKDDVKSLLNSDFVKNYNPFQTYFKKLPEWDGFTDYIKGFAGCVKTDDDEFFAEMLKKHLVRCVSQAFTKDINRFIFVLFGKKQNAGKSLWIKYLNPFGDEYYTESPIRDNKDSEIAFAENFIYNIEELASLSNVGVDKLKAIISKCMIQERRAYRSNAKNYPRRCNFFASTNKEEFLTDTENTRWLCFNVKSIDFNYHNHNTGRTDYPIAQIWAQAYALYKNAYICTLTPKECDRRDQINREYNITTNELSLILKYLQLPTATNEGEFMTPVEIITYLQEKIYQSVKLTSNKLGREMTKAGFVSVVKYGRGRGYMVIKPEVAAVASAVAEVTGDTVIHEIKTSPF